MQKVTRTKALVSGCHHLTQPTDRVQEDYDFCTKNLDLSSVRRTVPFDGVLPVYYLFYGSRTGDASTIITIFPFRKPAIHGRGGRNQTRTIMQPIPVGASDTWVDRLNAAGIPATRGSRSGLTRVVFPHPCAIPHELVQNPGDTRAPIANAGAGNTAQVAIRGICGAGTDVFDIAAMNEFIEGGVGLVREASTGEGRMYSVPDNLGPHSVVAIVGDRVSKQGTWMLAGGTVHRMALNAATGENRIALKARLEGTGFTDVSEQKDRN